MAGPGSEVIYGDPLPSQSYGYGSDYGSDDDDYVSGDLYGNEGGAQTSENAIDDNLSNDIAKKIEDFFSHASRPEKTFLKRVIKHVYKHLQGDD